MNVRETYRQYRAHEAEIIHNNRTEILESNNQVLHYLLLLAAGVSAVILLISAILPSFRALVPTYTVMLALFCAALAVNILPKKHSPQPTAVMYAIYIALLLNTWYTAILYPGDPSIMILAALAQLPIVVLDKSWRVNTVEVTMLAVYLLLIVPLKAPALRSDEVVNSLMFAVSFIGLGEYFRYTRLQNFEMKRREIRRATTDSLTELGNRRRLFETLEKTVGSESRQSVPGILMLDIDNFKAFNDTYGHQSGDNCLAALGRCLQQMSEEAGAEALAFYRYGGEEFIGLVRPGSAEQVAHLGEEINERVRAMAIPHQGSRAGIITVSVGAAMALPELPPDYSAALRRADTALYVAKSQGRNRTVLYTVEMGAEGETVPV